MIVSDAWRDYRLLDCSDGERLESWGGVVLVRPDPQVIWKGGRSHPAWSDPHARYIRSSTGGGRWENYKPVPERTLRYGSLRFHVRPTNFKHTGLFPEQAANWDWAAGLIRAAGRPVRVLNLFAYTGAATLACAAAGASVCHVDAARGMVQWARENAAASGLSAAPIRYIVDDCVKFVQREIRRGSRYDAVILDPPSYGRGPGGEIWKLEEQLYEYMEPLYRYGLDAAIVQDFGVLEFLHRLPLQIVIAAPPDKIQYIGPKSDQTLLVMTDEKVSYV